jgi:glycosyltransferase involved in cell wall biosynthesis
MSRSLRLLFVAHGWPPREQAGAELVAAQLAQALARRGHAVAAFAATFDRHLPPHAVVRESVGGVAVTRVRTAMDRADSLHATVVDARVRELFEAELARGVDLVHVHHLMGLSSDLVASAKRAGARAVVTLHDFWYHCARGQRLMPGGHLCSDVDLRRCARCIAGRRARWGARFVARRPLRALAGLPRYLAENVGTRALRRRVADYSDALAAADVVTAPSQFLLDEHVQQGLAPAKARFVENGIDAAFVARLPSRGAPARPLRFGYVGSLLKTKGVDLLLDAFAPLAPERARLDLFGASPWDGGAWGRRLEREHARANVRFHGPFTHDRLADVLAQIDVLVVPSRWFENAPVTLDEAALAEIPVVVAGHGGMAEWTHCRGNGLLFRPDDALDLRAALERFVNEASLWESLRRPRHPVQGVDDSAAEFEALYLGLLAAAPPAAASAVRGA